MELVLMLIKAQESIQALLRELLRQSLRAS
jgi:hypothetical protein